MAIPYTYTYSGQIKSYLSQFLRLFSGLQVEYDVDRDADGTNDRKRVNVHYGSMDRIVADVLNGHNQNTRASLPIITGYMSGLNIDQERMKGKPHREAITQLNDDGTRTATERLIGIPYKLNVDVSIWSANQSQQLQILEQVLILFDPKITFRRSNTLTDWGSIACAELVSINSEENFPAGGDQRMILNTLSFEIDAWINYDNIERQSVIEEIELNMFDNTVDINGIDMGTTTILPEDN